MSNESKQEVVVSRKQPIGVTEVTHTPSHIFGPLEEVERLFGRLMPSGWLSPISWNWPIWPAIDESSLSIRTPKMDVMDRDEDVLIHVEMPGVEKRDVDVSVNNSTLVIKGSVQRETGEHRKNYYRCEIAQGSFARSLAIPSGIDKTRISATLKDGILEVKLPKEPEAQRRNIEVK